jgi:hypothetical protein
LAIKKVTNDEIYLKVSPLKDVEKKTPMYFYFYKNPEGIDAIYNLLK